MAVDGGAGSAAGGGAGVAAADALNPRPWLQAEVLSELRGPLAINSKPEARWVGPGQSKGPLQMLYAPWVMACTAGPLGLTPWVFGVFVP
jgi:hypothetical protein